MHDSVHDPYDAWPVDLPTRDPKMEDAFAAMLARQAERLTQLGRHDEAHRTLLEAQEAVLRATIAHCRVRVET